MASDTNQKDKAVLDFDIFDAVNPPTFLQEKDVVDFLFKHLDQYGDPEHNIRAAIEYACSGHKGKGGFVLAGKENGKTVGAVVINHTGMTGYIPENILVYIAVDASMRGKGVGKQLMKKAVSRAKGDVALHVEPENPAKFLYENIGFTNKYLEMRYTKND
jgi:GNAT superfamily N-acetyltransferase